MKFPKRKNLLRIPKYEWKPPVNAFPVLVREDSVVKSMVLLDRSQPILLSRLDEIGESQTGWVNRAVPPPQLTFNVPRNNRNRFFVRVHQKGPKQYTILSQIEGTSLDLVRIIQWRFGYKVRMIHNEKYRHIVLVGRYVREINTLLQALGF